MLTMKWDKEAERIIESAPIPPVMACLARLDAERRAMLAGLDIVTAEIARQTERGYRETLGDEATELIGRMNRGEPVDLPEEFFEEDGDELYALQICPAKFGACSQEKREMIKQVLVPIRTRLKDLDVTRMLMAKTPTTLMSHHVFRVAIIGCPNCCLSPHFADIGVICQYRPVIEASRCSRCGACSAYCSESALAPGDESFAVNYQRCIMCGGCAAVCPQGAISISRKGYKILAGGCGGRHPQIAGTVAEGVDAHGVVRIVDTAVELLRQSRPEGHGISLHALVKKHGINRLTPA